MGVLQTIWACKVTPNQHPIKWMLNSSSYISHQSDHFNHQCFLPSCKSYHLNTMVRHFFKYFIDNCQLEYVSEHKHIGIQLSSNLSWSEHNADIVKKNV